MSTPDSGIDTDFNNDMESITSTNYQFKHEGERRFHGVENNPYPLPNDDEEVARLDALQFACRSYLKANIIAPISSKPTHIGTLDLGAGSGAWAIEVAEQFPSAQVRGVDISPIQPTDVPYNCDFILADLNEDLNFADTGSLDLVHSRIVTAGIKSDRWPFYMSEIHRILKPGTGWVQCTEFDGVLRCDDKSVPNNSAIFEFNRLLSELFATKVRVYADHLPQTVRDAGFIDVSVRLIHFKIGGWGKDNKLTSAGRAGVVVWSGIIGTLVEGPMRMYYPDDEKRKEFAEKVKSDLANPEYHLYSPMRVVIGRKAGVDLETGKDGKI